jgi:hypothetical protein
MNMHNRVQKWNGVILPDHAPSSVTMHDDRTQECRFNFVTSSKSRKLHRRNNGIKMTIPMLGRQGDNRLISRKIPAKTSHW